jgi:hypothetical protein
MRIAYATTDEVNQAWAARMTAESSGVLSILLPKGEAPDGLFDAVLHDLDSVPRARRQEVLAHLLSCQSTCPQGVHGYDLTDEQVHDLRRRGVAVSRQVGPELVRALCRAVDGNRAFIPAHHIQQEDTRSAGAEKPISPAGSAT